MLCFLKSFFGTSSATSPFDKKVCLSSLHDEIEDFKKSGKKITSLLVYVDVESKLLLKSKNGRVDYFSNVEIMKFRYSDNSEVKLLNYADLFAWWDDKQEKIGVFPISRIRSTFGDGDHSSFFYDFKGDFLYIILEKELMDMGYVSLLDVYPRGKMFWEWMS